MSHIDISLVGILVVMLPLLVIAYYLGSLDYNLLLRSQQPHFIIWQHVY